MAGRIRIRARQDGDFIEVKALMRHPMETGQRKDSSGKPIPAHYITEVKATLGDRLIMHSYWGTAISQNPFLGFRFQGGEPGDTVKVVWLDNKGETGEGEAVIR